MKHVGLAKSCAVNNVLSTGVMEAELLDSGRACFMPAVHNIHRGLYSTGVSPCMASQKAG